MWETNSQGISSNAVADVEGNVDTLGQDRGALHCTAHGRCLSERVSEQVIKDLRLGIFRESVRMNDKDR